MGEVGGMSSVIYMAVLGGLLDTGRACGLDMHSCILAQLLFGCTRLSQLVELRHEIAQNAEIKIK
jgi:hypothetical protein